MDVPWEIFNVISCHIIQSNSFGHQFKETSACIDVAITNMKKAVFIFNKMNLDGVLVSREYLLKKSFESSSTAEPDEATHRCEVVVTEAQPLTFK